MKKICSRLAVLFTCIFIILNNASAQSPQSGNEKNSFSEVTSKLETNGNFYLYMSTEQWVKKIERQIENLKELFSAASAEKTNEDLQTISSVFDIILNIYRKSGVNEISGIGMSSIAKEDFYRNVICIHHYKENNKGKIWSIFGKSAHKISGLDLLSANTVFAGYADFDAKLSWDWFNEEFKASVTPELEAKYQNSLEKAKTDGVDLEKIIPTLDGEIGIVITLDEEKKITIPIGGEQGSPIPLPAIMLILKVKDDSLFTMFENKIKTTMPPGQPIPEGVSQQIQPTSLPQKNAQSGSNTELRKIVCRTPIPYLFTIPTIVQKDNYLFIATGEEIILDALAVRSGKKSGLISTDEFKKIAANIPLEGNSFKYVSPRLGQFITEIQQKALPAEGEMSQKQKDAFTKMLGGWQNFTLFSVSETNDEGFLSHSNSTYEVATMLMTQMTIAPTAILAGMLLPALSTAREKARTISCASNLKQIGLALRMYSMDHNGQFPAMDGAAALEILRKEGYLENTKMFICPSSELKEAPEGTPISEETCSFIYFGGFTEEDSMDIPLAIDKVGNHDKITNILFLDGHVESSQLTYDSYVEFIEMLHKNGRLSEDAYGKLLEKAKKFDEQLRL